MIYNLFYQLVVNMGKYLPQKGKVRKNNECLMTQVIFANLSLFRKIFPHIKHNLLKQNKLYNIAPMGKYNKNLDMYPTFLHEFAADDCKNIFRILVFIV